MAIDSSRTLLEVIQEALPLKPRILVNKSIVIVKCENHLLKLFSVIFPGSFVQGMVIVNPFSRFTKTNDFFAVDRKALHFNF